MGVLSPTLTICVIAAAFFERFKDSDTLQHVMTVIRPVSVGLIWGVLIDQCQTNYIIGGSVQIFGILIGILGTLILVRFKWSIPKVICAAAVLGVVFCQG